jgi:uncharacterized protein YutE (UPF0331/DUF86 family)
VVDRDIVVAKLQAIDRCVDRLRQIRETPALSEIDRDDLEDLNLQRLAQATIDLAAHIVATEGLGVPSTLCENFILLQRRGIIDATLAGRLQSMGGFRNIAVHEYEEINRDIVQVILTGHLQDPVELGRAIVRHFRL